MKPSKKMLKMKPSEAMLKGFAMAGGNQCIGDYFTGERNAPDSVCALGAITLGAQGDAGAEEDEDKSEDDRKMPTYVARQFFQKEFEIYIADLSDGTVAGQENKPMGIEDIAGILAAWGH